MTRGCLTAVAAATFLAAWLSADTKPPVDPPDPVQGARRMMTVDGAKTTLFPASPYTLKAKALRLAVESLEARGADLETIANLLGLYDAEISALESEVTE